MCEPLCGVNVGVSLLQVCMCLYLTCVCVCVVVTGFGAVYAHGVVRSECPVSKREGAAEVDHWSRTCAARVVVQRRGLHKIIGDTMSQGNLRLHDITLR